MCVISLSAEVLTEPTQSLRVFHSQVWNIVPHNSNSSLPKLVHWLLFCDSTLALLRYTVLALLKLWVPVTKGHCHLHCVTHTVYSHFQSTNWFPGGQAYFLWGQKHISQTPPAISLPHLAPKTSLKNYTLFTG